MIVDENLKREYENLVKRMESEFTENLITLNTNKEEYKTEFIQEFILNNKENLLSVAQYNPLMFLKTISNLRHPQFQYEILNIESESINHVKKFLEDLNNPNFEKLLKKLFSYPLEVSVEEYYRKWVGKPKIHVKFAKNILGQRYQMSKDLLKNNTSKNNDADTSHLNGINLDYYKTSLEEVKKVKEDNSKTKKKTIKGKKESKFKSLFKKK